MERIYKGAKETTRLLMSYAHSQYKLVVYVAPDPAERNRIEALLKSPELVNTRERVRVLPLYVPDGKGEPEDFADDPMFLYGY